METLYITIKYFNHIKILYCAQKYRMLHYNIRFSYYVTKKQYPDMKINAENFYSSFIWLKRDVCQAIECTRRMKTSLKQPATAIQDISE